MASFKRLSKSPYGTPPPGQSSYTPVGATPPNGLTPPASPPIGKSMLGRPASSVSLTAADGPIKETDAAFSNLKLNV